MTTAASSVLLGTTERVAEPMVLDLAELLTSGLYVQGNSGSGKSGLLRLLIEETHGRVQQLVIDAEGDYVTLSQGFADFVIVGDGEHTAPLPQTDAKVQLLAVKLYELGLSAIVNLSHLDQPSQQHFARVFLDELLVNAVRISAEERHHALVFIDEAQIFAPEQTSAESTKSMIDLGFRGRKRGLHPVLATQRLSNIDKGAVSQLPNKIIGRTTFAGDQNRAADELGLSTLEKRALRDLAARQFIAYGPALCQEPTRFRVADVKTRMPKVGDLASFELPAPSPEVLAALAALGEVEAEAGRQEQQVSATARRGGGARPFTTPAAPACGHEAELSALRLRVVGLEQDLYATKDDLVRALMALGGERNRTSELRTAIDTAMAAFAATTVVESIGEPVGRIDERRQRDGNRGSNGSGAPRSADEADRGTRQRGDVSPPRGGGASDVALVGPSDVVSAPRAVVASAHGRSSLRGARSTEGLDASGRDRGRDTEDMKDEAVDAMLESKLSARLAGGASVIVVAPAEALRHEYQQRAVDYVMQRAGSLGDDSRDILRWMLAHFEDGTVASRPASAIAQAVTTYREGRIPDKFSNALRALVDAKLVEMSGRGGSQAYRPRVREWIRAELTVHRATIEEEEATYQAFLAKIAGAS